MKMALADRLRQEGWYLTSEGVEQVTDKGAITDLKAIIRRALDFDLKEIGDSTFIEDVIKSKVENLDGHRVVQIQKIRNVSAPKANEESRVAPRMLKLLLSDGHTSCQAVEVEHLPALRYPWNTPTTQKCLNMLTQLDEIMLESFCRYYYMLATYMKCMLFVSSLNTPPGTKLRFKPGIIPLVHGMVQLRPNLLEFLGGRVAPLVEKWELNRTLAKHTRGRIGEEGGPPPWIPFGQKIMRPNPNDRNFKSLDTGSKENKENPEFEAQRKDAIAEAARAGNKKIFGGGTKQMLDHNVQQIVDLGFTVAQAEYALKQNRNNVDRALKNLQRREDSAGPKIGKPEPRGRKKGEREREKDEDGTLAKPSAKVSLFDFLEDKLPILNDKEPEKKGNNFGERRGERKVHDSRDFHRDYNHGSERRGGGGGGEGRGGYSRQYQSSDVSWTSDRHTRQGERTQGQKPPRFQQQAQRFQQRQQQQQQQQQGHLGMSKQSSSQSSPFDSYQTWSGANEYQNQWGSFSAFGGLANDNLGKDVFRQSSSRPNEDHIGEWKPPGHKDRWKNEEEDRFRSRPPPSHHSHHHHQQQQHLSTSAGFSEYNSRREEATSIRNPQLFGGDTNHHAFSLGSQLNFSSYQSGPSDTSLSSSSPSHFLGDSKPWQWHEGDKCMAKYWEDNRHYRADVTGVSDKTVVVRFLEYGNFEEVLHEDCIPITEYD